MGSKPGTHIQTGGFSLLFLGFRFQPGKQGTRTENSRTCSHPAIKNAVRKHGDPSSKDHLPVGTRRVRGYRPTLSSQLTLKAPQQGGPGINQVRQHSASVAADRDTWEGPRQERSRMNDRRESRWTGDSGRRHGERGWTRNLKWRRD